MDLEEGVNEYDNSMYFIYQFHMQYQYSRENQQKDLEYVQ